MRWPALVLVALLAAGCSDPPQDTGGEPAEPGPAASDGSATRPASAPRPSTGPSSPASNSSAVAGAGQANATVAPLTNGPSVWHHEDTFELDITETYSIATGRTGAGSNCVHVRGAPFTLLGGTATLTWTAQSPATADLELVLLEFFGDSEALRPSGPSPLVMTFGPMPPADAVDPEEFYVLSAQTTGAAAVAVQQAATLVLSFDVEASEDVEISLGGCAIG